jgi:hypothetical protein
MKNRRKNLRIGRGRRRREIPTQSLGQHPTRRKRRGKQFLRLNDVKGKTVEFVEMYTAADFPCIEIGFADKTALHFLMDTRLTMEPTYSNWKTGNQRLLRRWPAFDCR